MIPTYSDYDRCMRATAIARQQRPEITRAQTCDPGADEYDFWAGYHAASAVAGSYMAGSSLPPGEYYLAIRFCDIVEQEAEQ